MRNLVVIPATEVGEELCLKKYIEIQSESTLVVPEESVELRVRSVRMDREGIEPVRKVEPSNRELDSNERFSLTIITTC